MSRVIVGLVVVSITLLFLIGCGGDSEPTDAPVSTPAASTPVSAPTATATPASTPVATTSTATPATTPTPAQTERSDTVSIEEYLTFCQTVFGDDESVEEDATNKETSAFFAATLAEIKEVVPPAEVAEWHNKLASVLQNAVDVFEKLPGDETADFGTFMLVAISFEADMEEATANLPADVALQMAAAGCIDPQSVPDDHGNDRETATPINVGEGVEGSIDYEYDSDNFSFAAEEGQLYRVEITLGTLGAGSVILKSETEWESSSQDPQNPVDTWKASESGIYYIEVTGDEGSGVGTYTLTLSLTVDDHGDDSESATAINVNEDVDGVIDYWNDVDVFQFTVEEGLRYQIDTTFDSQYVNANVYATDPDDPTQLWWVADNLDQIQNQDDSGRNTWTADESGDYYIEVDGQQASYTLTIIELSAPADAHGNDVDGATAVRLGEAVNGTIDPQDDLDVFRFTAEAGKEYHIDVELGTLAEWWVRVLDSNGTELTQIWDSGIDAPWYAIGSGDYFVEVKGGPLSWETGTYTLTISEVTSSSTNIPTPIAPTIIPAATPAPTPAAISPDRAVLEALYNATDGPNWRNNDRWLSDRPIGEWSDVTTDDEGRVIELVLWSNELSGEIPSELGNLANLEILDLGGNELSGEIPPELGKLESLEVLDLNGNELSGEIPPELGKLESLEVLHLGGNELSGEIPLELGKLESLEVLLLTGNQLSGCVPEDLGDVDVVADIAVCSAAAGQASPTPEPTPTTATSTPTTTPAPSFRLVQMGASGLEPDLATSWSISGDGDDWTFNLRRDARFGDGSLATAADVLASIQAWAADPGGLPSIASHSQTNDFTLSIQLTEPDWDFLGKLAAVDITNLSP